MAGHFEFAAIDGIMPAFDVDGAFEAVAAEFGNDFRPVGVAEARRAVEGEGLRAVDAVFGERVAMDRGVLSMDEDGLALRKDKSPVFLAAVDYWL